MENLTDVPLGECATCGATLTKWNERGPGQLVCWHLGKCPACDVPLVRWGMDPAGEPVCWVCLYSPERGFLKTPDGGEPRWSLDPRDAETHWLSARAACAGGNADGGGIPPVPGYPPSN